MHIDREVSRFSVYFYTNSHRGLWTAVPCPNGPGSQSGVAVPVSCWLAEWQRAREDSLMKSDVPKPSPGFFNTAILGALLVVVPAGIAGWVLWQMATVLRAVFEPVAKHLPFDSTGIKLAVFAASLLLLLLVCYFTGLFVRTAFGARLKRWLERRWLDRIPGYRIIRRIINRYLGDESETAFRPVLVDLYGAGTLMVGFLVEDLGHGRASVFLPSVPAVTLGQLQIVPASRITALDAPLPAVAESLAMYGEGLGKLIQGAGTETASLAGTPVSSPDPVTGKAPSV